jgi:hypothetical protein
MGKDFLEEKREEHPSYGMVGINRCQSSGTNLFGSIAKHHSFITLEIRRASVTRHLSNDWYHAESLPLIEIELTHTQFGELITSPGVGNGVPCTIRQINGKSQGECPEPPRMVSKFEGDLKATTAETVSELKALRNKLNESLLPGNKPLNKTEQRDLLEKINSAIASVESSIPYIEQSFGEELEKQTDKAFAEVEAYAGHLMHNIGERALGAHLAAGNGLPEFRAPQLGTGKGKDGDNA